jgi:hypothetical protein
MGWLILFVGSVLLVADWLFRPFVRGGAMLFGWKGLLLMPPIVLVVWLLAADDQNHPPSQ